MKTRKVTGNHSGSKGEKGAKQRKHEKRGAQLDVGVSCPIIFCQTGEQGHVFLWVEQGQTKETKTKMRTNRDILGSSGMGWSCSASASVFSSVDPPYGSSSFTIFPPPAAFFCLLSFSTLLQGQKKGLVTSLMLQGVMNFTQKRKPPCSLPWS